MKWKYNIKPEEVADEFLFFPLHFLLWFSLEPNRKQKEILQIGTLLPTSTTHPWQCSPQHNCKQESQPKSTVISILHLLIKPSRGYTGLPKHAHWFKGWRKPLPCCCHPLDMVMPFTNHCYVITIHCGLSPPLQVQPRFGFCVVDIIDWLGIDPLQGPRKKIPTTNCIQSPPHLSHSISSWSSRCTLSWIFRMIFFLCF